MRMQRIDGQAKQERVSYGRRLYWISNILYMQYKLTRL